MLNISEELKAAFLTDSTHKDIQILFEGELGKYSKINFCNINAEGGESGSNKTINNAFYLSYYGADSPVNVCWDDEQYLVISGSYQFNQFDVTSIPAPSLSGVGLVLYDNNDVLRYVETLPMTEFVLGQWVTFKYVIPTASYSRLRAVYIYIRKSGGAYYDGSDKADRYSYNWNDLSVNIGNDPDEMPFPDTINLINIEAQGKRYQDYILSVVEPNPVTNDELCQNAFTLSEHICSSNVLKFGASEGAQLSFDAVGIENDDLVGRYFTASIGCEGIQERIPLGRFRVKSVTKEGSYNIVKKHIEAYDGMYPLSMDATDWFTKNIGIYNEFYVGSEDGKILSRQLFNTLVNACDMLLIKLFETWTGSVAYLKPLSAGVVGTRVLEWRNNSIIDSDFIEYAFLTDSSDPNDRWVSADPTKAYKIDMDYDYRSDIFTYIEDGLGNYAKTFGMYPDNGGIVIVEYAAGGVEINRFCVDENKWFTLDPDTNYFVIGIPTRYHCYTREGSVLHDQTFAWPTEMTLLKADYTYDLVNSYIPLVYYNWQTLEVAKPTNITFRDVIRSLVEPTGTFFKYGRDGKIQFAEASVDGLYPSETLYPADDLYPRGGVNQVLPMARYKSFRCDDSATSDYGKIQIIASDLKTYTGDVNKPNVYIMDDNIFYCDSVVTYVMNVDGTESLPQVVEMLTNLYDKIAHVRYTPCEVDMVGMPWVECGDRITLLTDSFGFDSFVFNRVLTGIQVLDDSVEALGETETEQIVELWR